MPNNQLFSDGYLRDFLKTRANQAIAEIRTLNLDDLVAANKDILMADLEKKHQISPLLLFLDQTKNEHLTPAIGVHVFKFIIPFSGDIALFRYRPNEYYLQNIEASVEKDRLIFSVTPKLVTPDVETIRHLIQREFTEFRKYLEPMLEFVRKDVVDYGRTLKNRLDIEYQRLHQEWKIYQAAREALPFPLEERDEKPLIYNFPQEPSLVKLAVQKISPGVLEEWILSDADYARIIDVLSSMSRVMELAPNAFYHLGEEQLRWFFVLLLNAHFKGDVTGETFIRSGKGDVVLIQKENAAVFVAECKVQTEKSGNQAVNQAIAQILQNLTWKETKAAILLFDQTNSPSALRDRAKTLVESSDTFIKLLPSTPHGHLVAELAHPSDKGRHVKVTIMVFSVPVSEDRFEKARRGKKNSNSSQE